LTLAEATTYNSRTRSHRRFHAFIEQSRDVYCEE
jgi:hypothetical protein